MARKEAEYHNLSPSKTTHTPRLRYRGASYTKPITAAREAVSFGHEVPQRPPAWHRTQERQRRTRAAYEEVKVKSAQRRLMRTLMPLLASIEDPEQRREEAERIWHNLGPVARLLVKEAS
jgi:hypothetical protein